ncbi:MAG TPA: hypothetical protein PKC49_03420 [Phycisphaerae bacterium]|nr:hypothetical protein [Phycisphaerae bacterium]
MSSGLRPGNVLFISGAAGVGASSLVVSLAAVLARRRLAVVVLDEDAAPARGRSARDYAAAVRPRIPVLCERRAAELPATIIRLCDPGPGINAAAVRLARHARLVVAVCADDALSAADAFGVLKSVAARGCRAPLAVVVTRVADPGRADRLAQRLVSAARRFLEIDAIGVMILASAGTRDAPRNGDQPVERLATLIAASRRDPLGSGVWRQVAGLFV